MNLYSQSYEQEWSYFRFGLIVTGKGERKHLPELFKKLAATGFCDFRVIGRIGQRDEITSPKRIAKMVGTNQKIPSEDESIGYIAQRFFDEEKDGFVIVIDDLEDRHDRACAVFDRYRTALDTILKPKRRKRASVHFLVKMLEAYYFADANAVNAVLSLNPPLTDYAGDVETMPGHPKNKLKALSPGFDEVTDGGEILKKLNVSHILVREDTCASLRTLFAWCVKILEGHPGYKLLPYLRSRLFCLEHGALSDVTKKQLDNL